MINMRKTFPFINNNTNLDDELILEIAKYIINKDMRPITIFIAKSTNNVIIRSISYELKLNLYNVYSFLGILSFNSIDEIYQFIKDILDRRNISILEINDRVMTISLLINGIIRRDINLTRSKEINNSTINNLYSKYSNTQENINNIQESDRKYSYQNNSDMNTRNSMNFFNSDNEEQLFLTQENRIIFRNGMGKGIIQTYSEIKNVVKEIEKRKKKKVRFYMLYKASEVGDRAQTFHEKCDNYAMTLIIIKTTKGLRFGGFTTKSWDGYVVHKIDTNAFIFSIDRNKTYDIIGHEAAIACYPNYGPIFFGCQIRIYDMFFTKPSTTCKKGICYKTDKDYELNNGEPSFFVKDMEVYALECVDV